MSKVTNPFQQAQNDGVSFLPEDYIARKSETRANLLCLSLFGVVMFAVIGAFFVTNRQWLSVRREQETINKLYTKETMKIEQLKSLEEQKTEMLKCHASQREWLRAHHGMDEYIDSMKRHVAWRGEQAGAAAAEAFVQHRGHSYPANDLLKELFASE